jgi:hypothetical protein
MSRFRRGFHILARRRRVTLQLLLVGVLAGAPQAAGPPAASLNAGDRVVVTDDRQSIRGRIADITTDSLALEGDGGPRRFPFATLRQIDRVGDSVANGTAIGAGIGGGAALALMAKVCSNSGCADTSASLDPRFVLLGSLIGAGVGAIVDAAIDRRQTVYRAGQAPPSPTAPRPTSATGTAGRVLVFGRVGWASLSDDEGLLGDGGSAGFGTIVSLSPRVGLQVAYDRHAHRRDFDDAGPPGSGAVRFFSGTEQLVTAKVLFFFRNGGRVRPYAGIGLGYLDSDRLNQSPTFVSRPNGVPELGPPEILRRRTQGAGLGLATGMDVRVRGRLSVLGDLTLDFSGPNALGSTRLTVGAGWRF